MRDPEFYPQRGAILSHLDAARAILGRRAPKDHVFELAGVMLRVERYLHKLIVILGKPGSGKTLLVQGLLRSYMRLFELLPDRFRLLVLDPAKVYWQFLARCSPVGVPLMNLSPHLNGSLRWDWAAEIGQNPKARVNLIEALMNSGRRDASQERDPFWPKKARQLLEAVLLVLSLFSDRWRMRDVLVPFIFPQFCSPLLSLSGHTRGSAAHDLSGKMGKGIHASASAELKQLAMLAAYAEHATKTFTVRDLIGRGCIMHLAFDPEIKDGYSRFGSALSHMLQLAVINRGEEHNYTGIIGDEARELGDMRIEFGAARGRQAGLFYALAPQSIAGLEVAWGKERVEELLELVNTLVCLSCGPRTAKAVSEFVGQVEGVEVTFNENWSHTNSTSRSVSTGSSFTRSGKSGWSFFGDGLYDVSHAYGSSHNVTNSESYSSTEGGGRQNAIRVRDAVLASELTHLPPADFDRDSLKGLMFNADTGAFRFNTRIRHITEGLPPFAHVGLPSPRGDLDGLLKPWTEADVQRLGLTLTPEMQQAINA
jgi:hypothetical protein